MKTIDIRYAETENHSDNTMLTLTDTELAVVTGGFGCVPPVPSCYGNGSLIGGYNGGDYQFGGASYGGQFSGASYSGGQFGGGSPCSCSY